MGLLLLYVIVFVLHGILPNDANETINCLETTSGFTTIPLTCESNTRIHVISKIYGNTTFEQCSQHTSNIYDTSLTSYEDGLTATCNGKQNTCEEGTLAYLCIPHCAIKIKHECVKDSMSVCSAVNTKSDNESVYLHSPVFPDLDKEGNNCSCTITGIMLAVTVVEYHPGSGSVNIITDIKEEVLSALTLYNKFIATNVSTVEVNYASKNGSMWIKVAGNGQLNIECMEASNITFNTIATSTEATTKGLTSYSESTSHKPVDAVTHSTSNDRADRVTTDAASGTSYEVTPSTSNESTEEEMTEAASSNSDAGFSKLLVLAVFGAAGGLLLVALITVTVVCCRRRTNSCQHTEEKDNGRKNPASPKMQQMHSFQNNVFIGNNQVDRVHIKLDVVIEPSRYVVVQNESTKVENKSTDQNEKVASKGLKFALHNKDETANGNTCHMIDNDIYVGGPMIDETPQEGMVDNHLSCSMNDSIAETETKTQENIDDLRDQEIAMVVNDLYHSYQSTVDQSNGNSVSNEPPQAAETLNIDDQENEEEGMIINDLYHSYQSPADQSHRNSLSNGPPQAAETQNIDDQENDKEEGMILNDLYHSYQSPCDQSNGNSVLNGPPQAAETQNIDDQENDKEEGMIINDLYHSYQTTPGCGTYNE